MQLEKWRGIRLPALDIPSEESFGEMKKTLEETGNCLLPQVLRLVSSAHCHGILRFAFPGELHNSFDTQTDRRQKALPKSTVHVILLDCNNRLCWRNGEMANKSEARALQY